MKAKELKNLWDLYCITNKIGGTVDYTAINPIAMMKYKQAFTKVSKVIYLTLTEEDDELCMRYIRELDALSRWNFGDKYGNLSEEEKRVNERIKQEMKGWTPINNY